MMNGLLGEKLFEKAKRYGFNDLLVEKLSIPKADDEFDEISDFGKKMSRSIELNKTVYRELILTVDFKARYGKIAFSIVKACKSKDNLDINAVTALENLKSKYGSVSAPSMIKLDKQFGES
jgi:hypothetical protein